MNLAIVALAVALRYPLDAPVEVTSTVGTYRIGHHHAGLDLGTGGRRDVRVLAALPGEVIRIKRSHVGYGRSVVLRHADGFTTVYGHLERFAPPLEALAQAEEAKRARYEVEKAVEPPLPVKAGDLLGWAGTSGTDLLHLHFELRRDNVPLNPLTNGLNLPDREAPRVTRLLFLPRDAGSQIEGLHGPHELPAAPPKPVRIAGRVGLAVEVDDRIPGSERALEPYRIALSLDGRVAHEIRYDRASYAEKGGTELDYLAEYKAAGKGRFHRLYREVGRTLVWPGPILDSLGELSPGPHTARIEVADAAGNTARLDVPLEVVPFEAPCEPPRAPPRPQDDALVRPRHFYTESTLVLPLAKACEAGFTWDVEREDVGPLDRPYRWTRTADGPALAIDLDPTATGGLLIRAGEEPTTGYLRLYGVAPRARLNGPGWTLEVGEDALFAPYPTDDGGPWTELEVQGLEPVGPPVSFLQTWRPARGPSRLSLALPTAAPVDFLGIYFQENGRLWPAGGKLDPKSLTVEADLVHLGPVRLMRDTAPPAIGDAVLTDHPLGARLEIPLTDAGSGIDTDTIRLLLDGVPIYPEYLAAYGRLAWRPQKPLPPGPHAVWLRVADRAGRRAERHLILRKSSD